MELLLLIAIAYAGARGVEALTHSTDRRHRNQQAEEAVAAVAASGPKAPPANGSRKEKPGPVEPGGTFSAAAPRSAALGGKAAVPLAVVTETGATMWKAVGEGYRQAWPEIRKERRQRMAERARRRQAEKEAAAAQRKADAAVAQAGPPPALPPRPSVPPTGPVPLDKDPTPRTPDADQTVPPAEPGFLDPSRYDPDADPSVPPPAPGFPDPSHEDSTPPPADPVRHLTVVRTNGEHLMGSPHAIIPEIRTLDGLMNALTLTRAMCQMRAEEAEAIAADDLTLSNRLDQIEADLAELEVDDATRAEIDALRDSIHAQSQAAAQYGHAAHDAADLALATANAAQISHGGIAEAVQSSPIELAAQAGYYER
ncbi:hypothetical protein [Streptomyces sp. NPDC005407]|uniref:hypothetical protein n=1 Tax=Streptomyces sp. NPDC005407 TaxID=3155340 RepID=UPI0033A5FB8D